MSKQVNLRMPTHIERLPRPDAPYYIWDGKEKTGWGGFGLQVQKTGRKVWVQAYRVRGDSKKIIHQLGTFDPLSFAYAHARAAAEIVYNQARDGIDPAAPVAGADLSARDATVADLVRRYLDEYAKPKKRSWRKDELMLERDVLPYLGQRKVQEIKRADIKGVLTRIAGRGSLDMADKAKATLSRMFNWGLDDYQLESNPCARIPVFAVKETDEDLGSQPLEPGQVNRFWHGLDETPAFLETKLALRFLMVTGVRPQEGCGGRWEEIVDGVWTVPAGRMKKKRAHRVPLSSLALEILAEAKAKLPESEFFFPSRRRRQDGQVRPVTVGALCNALNRGAFRSVLQLRDDQSPYSLRKFAATTIGGLRHPVSGEQYRYSEYVRHILAHRFKEDDLAERYNKERYDEPKLMMLEQLAGEIRRLIAAKPEVAALAA